MKAYFTYLGSYILDVQCTFDGQCIFRTFKGFEITEEDERCVCTSRYNNTLN